MLLGENIFTQDLRPAVERFSAQERGPMIFAKEVAELQHYGVVDEQQRVVGIEEKPLEPKSNLAQTGIYLYDERVFTFMDQLTPSARGELEITDLNNIYVSESSMRCEILDGWRIDAGTSQNELLEANNRVAELRRQGVL